MAINYVQTLTFNLAGSGSNVADTSITLKSFSDIDNAVLTMASFGTKGYGTLEPGTTGQEEAFTFTGITANSNGTYTLTGVSHQLPQSPYTETSGLRIQHNGSTNVVISNTAGFYSTFANKNNDETITGSWSIPTPTIGTNPTTKNYVDGLVVAGAPDANATVKGVSRLSASSNVILGTVTVTIASPAVFTLVGHGLTVNDTITLSTTGTLPTGLVAGNTYYVISTGLSANSFQVSNTFGGASVNTSGTQTGIHTATKTTPISVSINDTRLPTQTENDALIGTSGTPSSTNLYVTNDDTSAISAANKVLRMNSNGQLNGGIVSSFQENFIAGENLTANDALCFTNGVALSPVTFDNSISSGFISFVPGNYTFSYTTNGNNRLLIVGVLCNTGTPTVTYNGVSMTQFTGPSVASFAYWFYLLNPTPGTNTVSVTQPSSTTRGYIAMSFNNVNQVAPTFSPVNTSISAIAGSRYIACANGSNFSGGTSALVSDATFDNLVSPTNTSQIADANGPMGIYFYPTTYANGTVTSSINGNYNQKAYSLIRIDPISTIAGVLKANAATAFSNKINNFFGFANATVTSGSTVTVTLKGIQTISGLIEGSSYYLSNTPGLISTTPGTVTKLVGTAISTTKLYIN